MSLIFDMRLHFGYDINLGLTLHENSQFRTENHLHVYGWKVMEYMPTEEIKLPTAFSM